MKGVHHGPRGTSCQCHWMRLSIRKKNIYDLGVEIRMVSKVIGFLLNKETLNEVKGVHHGPRGTPCQCHWMCLSIRNKNIYG